MLTSSPSILTGLREGKHNLARPLSHCLVGLFFLLGEPSRRAKPYDENTEYGYFDVIEFNRCALVVTFGYGGFEERRSFEFEQSMSDVVRF
jgi:hypothetical protein